MPLPSALLILGTTQYDDDDDDLCGKCLNVKGKFKSPTSDTVSIINSNIVIVIYLTLLPTHMKA